MRVLSSHHIAVSLAFFAAKWFQPPAVLAVILTLTLSVALRQSEKLKSWRQSWIVAIVLGSGLTIALAFLIAVQWMTKIGIF
jgi:ABC-type Mn2+/Zn2+ transport system permease subunit